ncbi:MAG: hypothetical protein CL931_01685 [Deltaproteobacteria bacterium]|nr:hypothetical protein [Deltaproteobacteria bacterium]
MKLITEGIRVLGEWGAVLFGIGFLAPLIAQSMDALEIAAPFGLPTIAFGLIVGPTAGVVAKLRGSWV